MRFNIGFAQIPKSVRTFLLTGLLFFCVWKLIYVFFLLPDRKLDRPLSESVAFGTAKTLGFFNPHNSFSTKSGIDTSVIKGVTLTEPVVRILEGDKILLSVADVCNALELFVLYAGFIICMPAPANRKLLFILPGIVLIFLLNILRCSALALIYLNYPQYLDFSHHYLFTTVVYGFIFLLWYIFAKKLTFNAKDQQ